MNVQGGQLTQTSGNPVFPGTHVTGPLLAGNIKDTGGPNVAGLGSSDQGSLANVGYAEMAQIGRVTQAQSAGVNFLSPDIVIPAQSLILEVGIIPIVAWDGASSNLLCSFGAISFTLVATTTTSMALFSGFPPSNWPNIGDTDLQLTLSSDNTGSGVGVMLVRYLQGINAATS